MDWFYQLFAFFSSNIGLLMTGALTALLILLWDWRAALAAIFVVQLSVGISAVVLHDVPAPWALIQTAVVGLVCVMLGMSAQAHSLRPSLRQTGTWISRGLLLSLLLAGAWFMNLQISLPGMDPLVMELFVWLVLCGIVLLGLSDHPLYTAVGLLLWLIPVQTVVAVVTPIPVVVAMVGLIILLVGLATSYLLYVEHMPAEERGLVLTDLAFPQQIKMESPPPAPIPPDADWGARRLSGWVERLLPGRHTPDSHTPDSQTTGSHASDNHRQPDAPPVAGKLVPDEPEQTHRQRSGNPILTRRRHERQ